MREQWLQQWRHPVQALTTQTKLASYRADSRVSAYVYGDILVLAATLSVDDDAIDSGRAWLIVVGTVVSTYLAHVLSDVVGAVFGGRELRPALVAELRDSVPVVSAGIPAALILAAGDVGVLSTGWAQILAVVFLVLRLAALGLVYRRLYDGLGIARALWAGMATAGFATVVAVLKIALTH